MKIAISKIRKIFNDRLHLFMVFSLVVLTAALFSPVLTHDFINYDDTDYITENPKVTSGWTREGLIWAFTSRLHGHWHPLTWLSHMTDYHIFGAHPAGHHFVSLLLHLANTLILFLFFNRITGALWKSAFLSALFAIHPLHVESVAWTADRKDILCAFFWMVSLWLYYRYTQRPSVGRYGLLVLGFVSALASKSMAVTLPFVLLLIDYWPLNRFAQPNAVRPQKAEMRWVAGLIRSRFFALAIEKTALFVLLLIAVLITLAAMRYEAPSLKWVVKILPSQVHVSNALISYVSYIGKMFWPADLSIAYPYFINIPVKNTAAAGIFLVGVTVFAWRMRLKKPYLFVGWLWYLITLLPAVGLIKSGPHAPADRYTYLPLIGLFIILTWAIPDVTKRWRNRNIIIAFMAIVVLSIMATWTVFQLGYWKNSETLFRRAVAISDINWIAHNNLGNALARQGRLDEAIFHYQKSLGVKPDNAKAQNNLGAVLTRKGRTKEAIFHLQNALDLKPRFFEARFNMADALTRQGEYKEAAIYFEKALRLKPDDTATLLNFGVVRDRMGDSEKAMALFNRVLENDPENYDALYNIGAISGARGQISDALTYLNRALAVKPESEDAHYLAAEAYFQKNDLKRAAAHFTRTTAINPQNLDAQMKLGDIAMNTGDLAEAESRYTAALSIKPDFAGAHNNLGVTYARLGDMEKAVKHFSEAVRLDPNFPGAQKNLERALSAGGGYPAHHNR